MSQPSALALPTFPAVVRLGDRSQPRQLSFVVHISGDPAEAPVLAANVVDALRTAIEAPPAPVVDFPKPELRAVRELQILAGARQVIYRDRPISFTRLEFDLLQFLCEHPRRVHRRSSLLAQVWKFPRNSPSERTIDIHVRRIRKKLGPEFELISTVRGIGYRLDPRDSVLITQ